MEAGADGFLSKLFAVDAVRGLLARLLGRGAEHGRVP